MFILAHNLQSIPDVDDEESRDSDVIEPTGVKHVQVTPAVAAGATGDDGEDGGSHLLENRPKQMEPAAQPLQAPKVLNSNLRGSNLTVSSSKEQFILAHNLTSIPDVDEESDERDSDPSTLRPSEIEVEILASNNVDIFEENKENNISSVMEHKQV